MALKDRLSTLYKDINAFLELHNNPYDTSCHNDNAKLLKQILDILDRYNGSDSTNTISTSLSSSVGKGGTNKPEDVRLVKQLLNERINAGLTPDNPNVGPKTNASIAKFQRKNDLPVTRLIQPGDDTDRLLNGNKTNDDSNSDDQPDSTDTSDIGTTIKESVGDGGKNRPEDVKVVQKLLKETWLYKDVVINGDGEHVQTVKAIREFQFRFAGTIKSQDGRVDAGGNTWKYLSGAIKPVLGVQEDGTLAGAETETEKKLAEFSKAVKGIPIDIGGGEIVDVRPPYHMNSKKRRPAIQKARAANSAVAKIINQMGWNDSHGKATPGAIKDFLQTCVDKGLVKDKTATGMNAFLDKYGVTLDCSGLAVQSINFLHDGDMDRDSSDVLKIVNAATLMRNGEKIKAPKDLKAGDMMCIKSHIRLITDVDITATEVAFTTIESGASVDLGYGGKRGTDGGDGVGERRWRFRNKNKFVGCERLSGNKWEKKDGHYVYRRITDAVIKKLMGK